jgi:hypothetical protein
LRVSIPISVLRANLYASLCESGEKTKVQCLVRNTHSWIYYARTRVKGKLQWKTLETDILWIHEDPATGTKNWDRRQIPIIPALERLAMKTYGHLRNEHSLAMAKKVHFLAGGRPNVHKMGTTSTNLREGDLGAGVIDLPPEFRTWESPVRCLVSTGKGRSPVKDGTAEISARPAVKYHCQKTYLLTGQLD